MHYCPDKLPLQLTSMNRIAWVAKANVYQHNLLRVITLLNQMDREGINPMSPDQRPYSMPVSQRRLRKDA